MVLLTRRRHTSSISNGRQLDRPTPLSTCPKTRRRTGSSPGSSADTRCRSQMDRLERSNASAAHLRRPASRLGEAVPLVRTLNQRARFGSLRTIGAQRIVQNRWLARVSRLAHLDTSSRIGCTSGGLLSLKLTASGSVCPLSIDHCCTGPECMVVFSSANWAISSARATRFLLSRDRRI